MCLIELPYSYAKVKVNSSPIGYSEIDFSSYNNIRIRNNYIVKIDILMYLNKVFLEDTVIKYRDIIYFIIAGYGCETHKQYINDCLLFLYKNDKVFRFFIGELFYFRSEKYSNFSFYVAFLLYVKDIINDSKDIIKNSIIARRYIGEDKLSLYYSVSDSISIGELKKIKGLEVVSL